MISTCRSDDGAEDLREIHPDGAPRAFPTQGQPVRAGGLRLDAREHAHLLRDVHRGPEQVDRVAAGLTQGGRPLDDGDGEAMAGQPLRQHRAGDAGAGDEDPHDDLPYLLNVR